MQHTVFAFIGTLGVPELVIIFFILMLIFGANRLSGLGRGMGQAIRGFKDEVAKDKHPEAEPRHEA